MSKALDQITIEGFKSIRELKDFQLRKLNVLIGANGVGKSNFVEFFRMLRAMATGGLRQFVTERGGGDSFFFNGPKETRKIFAQLDFGPNKYRFDLAPTATSELMVKSEQTFYTGSRNPDWWTVGGGGLEAGLKDWEDDKSAFGNYLSVQGHIYEAVSSWVVYHVHDTSSTAPVRRDHSVHNFRELLPDAANIAPFLLKLRGSNPKRYLRIKETVQLIAPFFDDFLLEPEKKGDNEVVRLQWRQKGSSFPFQPWQFSDGTIRFICLATALLQPRPPSTILIDEPELGLHPVALEYLAALIHEASLNTQVVISTQSTNLLDHFDPEDIVIVDRHEGASVFRRLESAELEQWLDEYSPGELVRKNIIESGPSHE